MGTEMRESFLAYAMSVIVARALPDVRDGLKPVHRRILYAMHESGITPGRPHKKSAWTVGEVIGKYHPHGDTAVYDAMARLAQDFSMREPLVDGHGNFGSADGDRPAAMRYTEARLSKQAMEMLRDLDKDTVDWQPNYDESLQEPSVLPSRFPNLLVNGGQGIAVGMATNIPTHNLGEVVDAACTYLDAGDGIVPGSAETGAAEDADAIARLAAATPDPAGPHEASLEELMKVLPGPDFPGGGLIVGHKGISDAYQSGRGSITLRCKTKLEETKRGKPRIVAYELPYGVQPSKLEVKINELISDKKLPEVSHAQDESDRKGTRFVIELKEGAVPQVALNKLNKMTSMQTTFGVNTVALVDGVPRTLSLVEIFRYYCKHQEEVIVRRTKFDLKKAQERAHILEGLTIALDNIDEVIQIIKSSQTDDEARNRLMERFGLDKVQTDAILEMKLRRLTGLEREKIENELAELKAKIAYYKQVLADPKLQHQVIKDEMLEIKRRFNSKRRTKIVEAQPELTVEDYVADEDMVVTITKAGYVKRLPASTYHQQKRGGKGLHGVTLKENDFVEHLFVASTHDYVLFFTNRGKLYRVKVYELPAGSRTAKGSAIVNFLQLAPAEGNLPAERVTAVLNVKDFSKDEYIFFVTAQGTVKKTALYEYRNVNKGGILAIGLHDGDALVNVRRIKDGDNVIMVSSKGKAIQFSSADVRAMGRGAGGVRGMRLAADEVIIGGEVVPAAAVDAGEDGRSAGGDLLVVTDGGYGKRTPLSEYPVQGRGGGGVFTIKMTEKKGQLVGMKVVAPEHELMLMSVNGLTVRVSAADIRECGRATQGVKVMTLNKGDRVSASTRIKERSKQEAKAPQQESLL
ncbi:MAG: DNA gyrase subunit A [Coriobacteriales bacterium]|nr:DNA gyrase subunit A [Coriobacteriales bacterium]